MSALCVDNSEKQKDLRIMTADLSIFKAYDIRGIVGKTLTEDVVRDIGRVLGTMAKEKRVDSICVGRA